ncbi:MAG: DUF6445 family protein [Bacteriovoracaceae bacterium]
MKKLKVIDNFYKKPEEIRNLALKTDYINVKKLRYPGIQSRKSFTNLDLQKKFEDVLDTKLEIDPKKYTFGKFRIMINEPFTFKAHLDGLTNLTGLVYLNPEDSCSGGTAFYRHRKSGLEGPLSQNEVEARGFSSNEEMFKELIGDDKYDPESWEMTDFVPMKFNRLLVFKGYHYFHCHTSSFGTDKESGRMTQLFFFNEVLNS